MPLKTIFEVSSTHFPGLQKHHFVYTFSQHEKPGNVSQQY